MVKSLVTLTCASGKQCAHIIPHLLDHVNLRLVVNSDSSLIRLREKYPNADVVKADLAHSGDCERVLRGANTVYHIGPPLHPAETQIGFNMIDAARAHSGTVQHFVLSSVLWSQLSKLIHHGNKRSIEESLIESGLNWTILSPTHFIDIIPVSILQQQDRPVFPMMWNPETRMSFISLKDLGEVSAKVILERERHYFAQYPLASTMPVTYTAVLQELGRQLGKEVRVDRLRFEDAVKRFMQLSYGGEEGVHPFSRTAAEMMLLHYHHYGLVGNPGVLKWLLGRELTGVSDHFTLQLADRST